MSELINLTRSLQIDGYQFVTTAHVDEVALDDESGPAVRIEQNWNYGHDDAPTGDVVEDDCVHLTWAEWDQLRAHVDAARLMMPGDIVDAAIMCGARVGDLACCLHDGHIAVARPYGHVTDGGAIFEEEVPF